MTDITIDRFDLMFEARNTEDERRISDHMQTWVAKGGLATCFADMAVEAGDATIQRVDLHLEFASVEDMIDTLSDRIARGLPRLVNRQMRVVSTELPSPAQKTAAVDDILAAHLITGQIVTRPDLRDALDSVFQTGPLCPALLRAAQDPIACSRLVAAASQDQLAAIAKRLRPGGADHGLGYLSQVIALDAAAPVFSDRGRGAAQTAWEAMLSALASAEADVIQAFLIRWASLNGVAFSSLKSTLALRLDRISGGPGVTDPVSDHAPLHSKTSPLDRESPPRDISGQESSGPLANDADLDRLRARLSETPTFALSVARSTPTGHYAALLQRLSPLGATKALDWLLRLPRHVSQDDHVRALVLTVVSDAAEGEVDTSRLDLMLAARRRFGAIARSTGSAEPSSAFLTLIEGLRGDNPRQTLSDAILSQVQEFSAVEKHTLRAMIREPAVGRRLFSNCAIDKVIALVLAIDRPAAAQAIGWFERSWPKDAPATGIGSALAANQTGYLQSMGIAVLALMPNGQARADTMIAAGVMAIADRLSEKATDLAAFFSPQSAADRSLLFNAMRMLRSPPLVRTQAPPSLNPMLNDNEYAAGTSVQAAGLVLLWPFLPEFFRRLALVSDGQFTSPDAAARAAHLIGVLGYGTAQPLEDAQLPIAKVLCGLPVGAPSGMDFSADMAEASLCADLLVGLGQAWTPLRNSTPQTIQEEFLQRPGYLSLKDERLELFVEARPFDMLLRTLPWQLGKVRLSWMTSLLQVAWYD